MLLRIAVGYHFYSEGTKKLKDGNFSSYGFLAGAKGPFASFYKGMLDDPEGMRTLCVSVDRSEGKDVFSIDPKLTLAVWKDYRDRAYDYYGMGSDELQQKIAQRREDLREKIQSARQSKADPATIAELERQREADEQSILQLREQPVRVDELLEEHKARMMDWLAENRIELLAHYNTQDRLDGFERDGENKQEVALYVDSVRSQVDEIAQDRRKKLNGWTARVTSIWDSYEQSVQRLAVDEQADLAPLPLPRPYSEEMSFNKVVDMVIPWFDTIVGGLLIIGLFSRLASLAAASFLFSVIMSQPPWVPGASPDYLYFIEFTALLVIFATCAGRMGGLDYFFSLSGKSSNNQPELEA